MAFGDKKKEQLITDSVAATIAEGIAQSMRPVFEDMTGQMKGIMEKLEGQQEASMKKMADAFLEEMRSAAAGMLGNVAGELEKASKEQKAATEQMNEAVSKLQETTSIIARECQTITEACASMASAAESMGQFNKEQTDKLESLGNKIEEATRKTGEVNKGLVEWHERYAEESAKALDDKQKEWLANYQTCDERLTQTTSKAADSIKQSAEALEQQVAGMQEATRILNESMSTYTETIARESARYNEKMNEGIKGTLKAFDTEMAGIARILADSVKEIGEVTKQIPRTLKGSIDELERTIKR